MSLGFVDCFAALAMTTPMGSALTTTVARNNDDCASAITTTVARRNKTEGKMTLSVDAARAAFNSSYATLSVKRDIARFCTPFCDWEPPVDLVLCGSIFIIQFIYFFSKLTFFSCRNTNIRKGVFLWGKLNYGL